MVVIFSQNMQKISTIVKHWTLLHKLQKKKMFTLLQVASQLANNKTNYIIHQSCSIQQVHVLQPSAKSIYSILMYQDVSFSKKAKHYHQEMNSKPLILKIKKLV